MTILDIYVIHYKTTSTVLLLLDVLTCLNALSTNFGSNSVSGCQVTFCRIVSLFSGKFWYIPQEVKSHAAGMQKNIQFFRATQSRHDEHFEGVLTGVRA